MQIGGLDAVRRSHHTRRGGEWVQPCVQRGAGRGRGGLCHRQQRVGDFQRGQRTSAYDEWAPQPLRRFLVFKKLASLEGLRADHDPHCAQEEGGDRGGILPLLAGAEGGPRPGQWYYNYLSCIHGYSP